MNKRFLRIFLAGLLVMVLAFTASGCGIARRGETPAPGTNNGPDASAGTKAGSIEGTYQAEVDMTDMISASSGIEINTKLAMVLNMNLESDKSYSVILDLEQFMNDTIDYYNGEMPSLIRQAMINEGIPEDMLDSTVQEQGYKDFDDFTRQLLDEMIEEMKEGLNESNTTLSKGTYEVSDGTISFNEKEGDSTMDKEGKIQSDGSIVLNVKVEETEAEVVFVKK
ncbi:MAG: hypothetical protein IKF90_00850 [Parasporobacterium sp.]|nr:hypothetical protein [Parasporobacterium sp.]